MPLPRSELAPKHSNPQHRAQLVWTGVVAFFLAIAALQQASSPTSSAIVLATPESMVTADPLLDSTLIDSARAPSSIHLPIHHALDEQMTTH